MTASEHQEHELRVACDRAVDDILHHVGKTLVVGIPLGLGKPVPLVNALYQRARRDSSISLTLVTALSLQVPAAGSDLERRFLEPFARRVFDGVPELDYVADQARGQLPRNIEIMEFYFRPGAYLGNSRAQQNYVSSNYTHVVRDLLDRGINVLLQMVAERDGRYSLASNPDLTLDLAPKLRQLDRPTRMVAMVNREMPFMPNDADVAADFFDDIVDSPAGTAPLFGVPNSLAAPADHAVGLYASALVKDEGTLQIGIGSLGDAVAHMLRLRHQDNDAWNSIAGSLELRSRYEDLVRRSGGLEEFDKGCFAASEMFTWGLMCLYKAGVLKREVIEHEGLQKALNAGDLDAPFTPDTLRALASAGVISESLSEEDVELLQYFNVLSSGAQAAPISRYADHAEWFGDQLQNTHLLHGAFFLGPREFYRALRDLPEDARLKFNMTAVSKVNDLAGEEALERVQRLHARFINVCMKVTLSGAAVSDGLEDGRVISGVGGQYNFVAMAHELENARSILLLRATREGSGGTESNIVFNYGHITIPRHLRDIVITEYGIADLRGATDSEVAARLIEIADTRFQPQLIRAAKSAGKLPQEYTLPQHARSNTPAALQEKLARHMALLPPFPLGTDFEAVEVELAEALTALKHATSSLRGKLRTVATALLRRPMPDHHEALRRMQLDRVARPGEWLQRRLVAQGLRLARARRQQ